MAENTRTLLTAEALSGVTGLEPTIVHPDHALGNEIVNIPRGNVFIRATNNEAVPITATALVTKTVAEDGEALVVESPIITLAAGESWIIGPWSANFEVGGKVEIDWGSMTSDANVDLEVLKNA